MALRLTRQKGAGRVDRAVPPNFQLIKDPRARQGGSGPAVFQYHYDLWVVRLGLLGGSSCIIMLAS